MVNRAYIMSALLLGVSLSTTWAAPQYGSADMSGSGMETLENGDFTDQNTSIDSADLNSGMSAFESSDFTSLDNSDSSFTGTEPSNEGSDFTAMDPSTGESDFTAMDPSTGESDFTAMDPSTGESDFTDGLDFSSDPSSGIPTGEEEPASLLGSGDEAALVPKKKCNRSSSGSNSSTSSDTCNGQNYDSKVYKCWDNELLCPVGNPRCGDHCYETDKYTCNNGQLQQI
ncbi:hypothetical protein BJ085DRAFT_36174 [Dimargaris cristalligena]|uniref:Endo-1,3(4)-beta-glucanase 1 carbohydrate binding domain-containing protein n=1 Tax=Dimargaris cristalligena TaxID=215637 RepID=A0A4P9ZPN6_9FUNG|nr:hypothetical protein BJ085DRAFT_36174 [Dimargaris cristalligena]|eukprot:RKP35215.1 hypothetical protein BJ085DRAFT_36174 [Dimargaris cristalligena]